MSKRQSLLEVQAIAVAVFASSALFLVSVLLALGSLNPMAWGFCANISLTNELDTPVRVTPIGEADHFGDVVIVPQYYWEIPSVPVFRGGGHVVAPGSSRNFIYDWDDVNLIGFVVDAGESRRLFFPTETLGPGCCYRPRQTKYSISSLEKLVGATSDQIEAASFPYRPAVLIAAAGLVLFPACIVGALMRRRQVRQPPN